MTALFWHSGATVQDGMGREDKHGLRGSVREGDGGGNEWFLSNTMETGLCLQALDNALQSTGETPEIFNTDQGSQFTSNEWTGKLSSLGVHISMDGKGRWMDNVFIERLWRSVKYEEIYLFEHATIIELHTGLAKWFDRYNNWRPHESLGNHTPSVVYEAQEGEAAELAKVNNTRKVG